ncbi:MAG: right-handed parallel beta-helix repeat-containing protein [Candidatus Bathyarchaeota archaeon]|nr:MAG: right-handed parallel beta-helix repeat-containing protein [Candidatus Bathyarchaeota archaeon]
MVRKEPVFRLALAIVFVSTINVAFRIQLVGAGEPVYIRVEGTVDGTDKILRNGEIYTFTGDIYDEIVVERDNIVVDGAGYTLQGSGLFASIGIDLARRSNVTVKNLRIGRFYHGIRLAQSSDNTLSASNIANNEKSGVYLSHSFSNTISRNNITNNDYGIRFYASSSNTISQNDMAKNEFDGLDLWYSLSNTINQNYIKYNGYGVYLHSSSDNAFYGNTIEANGIGVYLWRSSSNSITHNKMSNNKQQVNVRSSTNAWDNGKEGNCWSDHEERYPAATEVDETGVWDAPYVIDEKNVDNYPLIPESPPPITLPPFIIALLPIIAILVAVFFYTRKPSD